MTLQTPGPLSKSTAGAPIAIGTGATAVHDSGSARVDDVVLALVNVTSSAVDATVAIAGGTGLVVTVPAKSQVAVGPFAVRGAVTVLAGSASAIYAIGSIRR